ncbi:MAG: hypothetical protein ACRDRP_18600 [Pseudonocardiaceae bacterium]
MTHATVLDLPREQEIRDELQRLVLADLHGPLGGDDEEFSGENPIDRYPLGRLAPRGVVLEPDTHDGLAAADAGDASEVDPEPSAPNVPSLNPSAVGFTAHVEGRAAELHLTATWARYELGTSDREETLGRRLWQRERHGGTVRVRLAEGPLAPLAPDPDQPDVVVRGRARRHNGNWLVSAFAEDDVSTRLTRADERDLAKRFDPEIRELTSRLSSDQIRPLLDLLAMPFPRAAAPPTRSTCCWPPT